MDYEKLYKDALSRARAFKLPEYKNIMVSVFPELKDSEDERIREAIINHLTQDIEIECILSKDEGYKWIAWLEKQGEKPLGKTALDAINDVPIANANKVEPKLKKD